MNCERKLHFVKKMGFAALLCLGNTYIQATEAPQGVPQDMLQPIPLTTDIIEFGTLRQPRTFDATGFSVSLLNRTYNVRLDIPSDFFENFQNLPEYSDPLFRWITLCPFVVQVDNSENLDVFNVIQTPSETFEAVAEGTYSRAQVVRFGEQLFSHIINKMDNLNANTKIILHFPKEVKRDLEATHKRADIRMCLLPRPVYEQLAGIQNPTLHQDRPTPTSAPQPNRNSKAS